MLGREDMGSLESGPVIGLDMDFRNRSSSNNTFPVAITDFITETIVSARDFMRNQPRYPRLIADLDRGWQN